MAVWVMDAVVSARGTFNAQLPPTKATLLYFLTGDYLLIHRSHLFLQAPSSCISCIILQYRPPHSTCQNHRLRLNPPHHRPEAPHLLASFPAVLESASSASDPTGPSCKALWHTVNYCSHRIVTSLVKDMSRADRSDRHCGTFYKPWN